MTEMHERLWHEWYDLWHDPDASASKPSYEDWLETRIEELERERAQVEQFIRDMYTGRFAKRESNYWMLPQWIRDAIEADPLYKEEA